MAASITLNVTVNKAKAISDISAVEKAADALTKTPHVINFTAPNLSVTIKEAKQATTALAEAAAAEQRRMAAQENRASAEARNATARVNALSREQQAEARAALSAQKHAERMEEIAARTNHATASSNAFAVALGSIAARGVHLVFRKITQALREALTEMKNVDTELTNISKVSGKTGVELDRIGDAAYETATKYGVAASEYLQAVYAMQKAGMGDQSEAMGELAVKTMLVGDTTQEVATKFLLATNAAWKLEGNMERLGQIVDEADYINNNYATSLDKLASGMPIVASVAENAGMSAEETMAALGTITAATQESGTKAATALRALILNISKETGKFITEEGEEFEVTAESVKTVQGLLEKYAKAEVDAAKSAGELLDPMTAIRALFKGMANDDLSDVELFNLLSGMGGKLRTNQLTALVKNFETLYTDMLGNIANAAGTADSEIELMMQSWAKRTQVLKNTWTKFIAHIVSTDTIKGGIDMLTEFVDKLDEVMVAGQDKNFFFSGQTQSEIDSTTKKVEDLQKALDELKSGGTVDYGHIKELERELEIQKQILEIKEKQYKLEHQAEAENLQERLTGKMFDSLGNPLKMPGGEQATADSWQNYMIGKDTENLFFKGNISEYQQELQGVLDKYKEYYDQVIKVRDADIKLTDAQKDFIEYYETVDAVSKDSALSMGNVVDGYQQIVDAQGNVVALARDYRTELDKQEAALDEGVLPAQKELGEQFQYLTDTLGEGLQPVADFFSALLSNYTQYLEDAQSASEALTSETNNATDATDDLQGSAEDVSFDEATASAERLLGVIRAIDVAASGISLGIGIPNVAAEGTKNAPGGPTLVNELGPELISENGRAYIANGGRPGIVNLSHGAIVLTADETEKALQNGITPKYAAANGRKSTPVVGNRNSTVGTVAVAAGAVILDGRNIANTGNGQNIFITSPTTTPKGDSITSIFKKSGKKSGGGSGSGGGDGGSTAKSVETLAKETKDILSNIEKQAKLADNRKQYDKEVSLWEKGQKEIDKMVAQYKKAGYKETDDEVLDLLNKRYDYEKKKEAASKKTIEEAADQLNDKLSNLDKQAKLADTNGDYKKEVQFYEKAQEAIKKMVEKYRKAGYSDDSDEIVDLLQKNVDYAEKQVKVYKDRWNDLIDALEADTEAQETANALAEKEQALADARQALENATKQRTVRTYNAATGQWEWVADQSKIKTAQESLTKAEENYSKEVKDQAISELERLRDTMADLNDVVLGPALSAIISQSESSDTFQNFARALNAVYGVGSYLSSTAGSSKVLSTADSHDTIYTFGNVTLTEEEASSMSVAQLARRLQVLKIS